MGVIGENIDLDLIKQIDVRREKLGKAILDPQDIIYNNSNNSWLRVASSVSQSRSRRFKKYCVFSKSIMVSYSTKIS